jgi:hypothetical protein
MLGCRKAGVASEKRCFMWSNYRFRLNLPVARALSAFFLKTWLNNLPEKSS